MRLATAQRPNPPNVCGLWCKTHTRLAVLMCRNPQGQGEEKGYEKCQEKADVVACAVKALPRSQPSVLAQALEQIREGEEPTLPTGEGEGQGGGGSRPPEHTVSRAWMAVRSRVELMALPSRKKVDGTAQGGSKYDISDVVQRAKRAEKLVGDSGLTGALRESLSTLDSLRKSQAQVISEAKVSYFLSSDRSRVTGSLARGAANNPGARTPTPELGKADVPLVKTDLRVGDAEPVRAADPVRVAAGGAALDGEGSSDGTYAMRVSAAELESDQELDATRWRDTGEAGGLARVRSAKLAGDCSLAFAGCSRCVDVRVPRRLGGGGGPRQQAQGQGGRQRQAGHGRQPRQQGAPRHPRAARGSGGGLPRGD